MDVKAVTSTSGSSPIVEAPSNADDNTVEDKKYIPQSETASCSSETKSLVDRSAILIKKITSSEMKDLILQQNFSNDVHYQVDGNLDLRNSVITTLPKYLSVAGNLDLSFSNVTTMPKYLSVKGNLDIDNTDLRALSEILVVTGYLDLHKNTFLKVMPKHLSLGGNLDHFDCPFLRIKPENFSTKGDLNHNGCEALTPGPSPVAEAPSYSDNSHVDGQEHIPQPGTTSRSSETKVLVDPSAIPIEKITSSKMEELILQKNFSNDVHYQVDGHLDLAESNITTLPKYLSVKGCLDIEGCEFLEALPEYCTVGHNLSASGCICLTTTSSKELFVGGNLDLQDCKALPNLPKKCFVGGNLNLEGCEAIAALPENFSLEDFFVGANLYITDCTDLTALPNWITKMGCISDDNIRNVFFENTGLSDAVIARLSVAEATGMRFFFSHRAAQPTDQFLNMEDAFTFWRTLASTDAETPTLNLRHDQIDDLVNYMKRLTSTADYKNNATRPVLAQRVIAVMSLLAGNDRLRGDVMRCIHDALSSCDDRIILALDELETLQSLISAESLAVENDDPSELKALGLKMMRLDEVKKIARYHAKTLTWVDEIEIELAYQIGVRQQLDLPGSTQHMIFKASAKVSDQDIANTIQNVNTRCSGAKFETYLSQWAPWQKEQRRQTVPPFDQLPLTTVPCIEECPISAEKTDKMVKLGKIHYDYKTLVKAYLKNGKDPRTNTPLDWSNVERLIEESPKKED